MNDITYEIRDGEHLLTEDEWRDFYAQEELLEDHLIQPLITRGLTS